MGDVTIRPATAADAATICEIYNQGIEDRLATLETELRTADERGQWLAARGPHHPVIVAEAEPATASHRPLTADAGLAPAGAARVTPAPIGWASLNAFNPRRAYDHVADLSVYVERGWRGRGVGRQLLDRLIVLGRELGYHKLALAAFPLNTAGVALYERCGFREVGVYREQGMLDGRWLDVVVMERLL